MSYIVTVLWKKKPDEVFIDNKYSRSHTWVFDGGIELAASSSPHIVPLPMSNEFAIDPEEAFIASISSCHMLWFLSIVAGKNYIVEHYEDNAEGILGKDEDGKLAMTKVTLKPKVVFDSKTAPSQEQIEELHHLAHAKCFIANSVKTQITIQQI
ncbi:MAG: OsmC family protein [Anaerolineae bacterium]|nr:OsmC family protein [Anaerolineae bacterium]